MNRPAVGRRGRSAAAVLGVVMSSVVMSGVVMSGVVLSGVAVSGVVLAPPAHATAGSATDVGTAAHAAAAYAKRHHLSVGIAVVDTVTGATYTAGAPDRLFPTASVAKTLIATRLLLEGRMTGRNARLARYMITASDNADAYALYPAVGRDQVLPWLARHYRITDLGTAPTDHGFWGSTRVTATGLARLYAAVRADKRVWPWLSKAMHAHRRRSSGGEPNDFGIAAAAPRSAVKNGWAQGRDLSAPQNAEINTTGFVDHDRYAVVVLGEGPGRLYYVRGERIVSQVARTLMPGGRITPVPPPVVGRLSATTGPTSGGNRITVTGRGFVRVTGVQFGTQLGSAVSVGSSGRLSVVVPPRSAGTVAVRVHGSYGWSAPTTYTYVSPSPAPSASRDHGRARSTKRR